jgi:neutral amino acid transport system substrate-binding protein
MARKENSIRIRANNGRRSRKRTWVASVSVVGAVVLALTSCSSTTPSSQATTSASPKTKSIVIADLAPFTGVDAALGPIYMASCLAATDAINQAGGVSGTTVKCKAVDTRGDPADAVPATRQMFATVSNLAAVIGVTSDEAAAVVPIINANKMVVFSMTGESEFDNTHFDYFYRLVAPDLAESYAMVAIAQQKHYKKIALAFGNDIGSQTFVAPAVAAIGKAGMKLVANETLDLKASTFRTEAAKIVAAHPDVIMTEALGATAASFLSEVKQLNGGRMIPIIGTSATIDPSWYKSVTAAIGATTLTSNYVADNTVTQTSGPAYDAFSKAMMAQKGKVGASGNFDTYLTAPGAVHLYDGINLAALAMIVAKSTTPSIYRPFIESIGNGVAGAVVVGSFADGVAALKKGSTIRYVGPGGPTNFDSYHDSTGLFEVDAYDATGKVKVVGQLTPEQLRALAP